MILKREEGGETKRRRKLNVKGIYKKKKMKLQPYLDFWVSETKMDSSCPVCVLFWCLSVPLCPPRPPLSLLFFLCCQKQPKTGSQNLLFCLSLPSSQTPFLYSCHVFPCFGMSMCYLLTLCMNDNMSVYSYRELYPIPP